MWYSERYYLKPGFVYITRIPTIISTVLGSCVGICMYDNDLKYGGMNHYLLAYNNTKEKATTQFGFYSIRELYKMFIEFGSKNESLLAHLVGGGHISGNQDSKFIANQNIEIAKKTLSELKIKIVSEDTGGTCGRRLSFYTKYNILKITRLNSIYTAHLNYTGSQMDGNEKNKCIHYR